MPKKRKMTATPAKIAAAAIARATRQIPEGFTAVQGMLWIPNDLLKLWREQKPEARGEAWVKGAKDSFENSEKYMKYMKYMKYIVNACYRSESGDLESTNSKTFEAENESEAESIAREYFERRFSILSDGTPFLLSKPVPVTEPPMIIQHGGRGQQVAIGNGNRMQMG
ncbi:MAG: hypothetical protein ACRC62_34925 [Microcoleus sp.]